MMKKSEIEMSRLKALSQASRTFDFFQLIRYKKHLR